MINILYAGNKKVFDMIMISTVSIANHSSEPINVYILTMDLSEKNPKYIPITQKQVDYLEKILKSKNKDNVVTLIDAKEAFLSFKFNNKNNTNLFTPYANLRLFADKLDLPSKIIYLDVDTVSNSDIAELFNQDITGYEMGVVRDVFIFGLRNHRKYFNSGMLLMNLDKMKETGLLEKARLMINAKKMIMLDQDALNFSCVNVKHLERRFNYIHIPHKRYQDAVIHHMCDCRSHLIFRYKSNDSKKVRKYMPYYIPLMDECDKYKEEAKDL